MYQTKQERLTEINSAMTRKIAERMEELKTMKEAIEAAMKEEQTLCETADTDNYQHPMIGRHCIIRTYSAGVHVGIVSYVNPTNSMEVKLTDAIRLWKWENGGLSLSAIANNGMKGGRCNYTGEVYLTNAIEYIPTTKKAAETFKKYIEDDE